MFYLPARIYACKKDIKVVRDPCQKITLLLLKSKSVRVIVPESCFLKENTYFLRRYIVFSPDNSLMLET